MLSGVRLAGGSRSRARLRRRYAGAPAATLLTGLGAGEWSAFVSLRYAHTTIWSWG